VVQALNLNFGGDEGISVKFGLKIARAAHVFEFPSAEMEKANGMAKLQIFVTLWGLIATFFTLEPILQFW